jgi:hypothetical protein
MALFIMITAILAGMPADTMLIAMGLMFGPSSSKDIAMMVGFGMHMLTIILIGIIFGAVVFLVKKLWITGFGKGIIEGHYRCDSICCFVYSNKYGCYATNIDENGYANEPYYD